MLIAATHLFYLNSPRITPLQTHTHTHTLFAGGGCRARVVPLTAVSHVDEHFKELKILCLQDKVQKVSNLLAEGSKPWLSDPQDRSGQVEAIFQLEQPCRLAFLDIGQH